MPSYSVIFFYLLLCYTIRKIFHLRSKRMIHTTTQRHSTRVKRTYTDLCVPLFAYFITDPKTDWHQQTKPIISISLFSSLLMIGIYEYIRPNRDLRHFAWHRIPQQYPCGQVRSMIPEIPKSFTPLLCTVRPIPYARRQIRAQKKKVTVGKFPAPGGNLIRLNLATRFSAFLSLSLCPFGEERCYTVVFGWWQAWNWVFPINGTIRWDPLLRSEVKWL